ncbi:OMP1 protein [Synechococcus phage Syn30]|uniref:OMP1 protein n=1 Tax=Synechococcus phage Syn30 TaxID=536474 RepID=M4T0D2_9CAUD|nr:OMP1 protein [Synechococcus phage Syn30]AGH56224.1 OMP1 protein [Synechococcus phage Syn30]|tara:strand:- start:305 stop:790 length:486 start_codon:yes stop_codon:yes gene_type:complete
MRKFLPIVMLLMAAPAHADITHRLSSSVQLQVNSAATQATRLGNSYAISGNNVNTTDGTTTGAVATGDITSGIYSPGSIDATQATAGEAFSFSTSFTQADAIPTSAATTGEIQNFGIMTSNAAGSAGDLAGTIDSTGSMALTAGGAGTSAIGQFSSEIIIK